MIEWFASHNGLEQVFLLSAIVGGLILVLRLILMVAGLDQHGDQVRPHMPAAPDDCDAHSLLLR